MQLVGEHVDDLRLKAGGGDLAQRVLGEGKGLPLDAVVDGLSEAGRFSAQQREALGLQGLGVDVGLVDQVPAFLDDLFLHRAHPFGTFAVEAAVFVFKQRVLGAGFALGGGGSGDLVGDALFTGIDGFEYGAIEEAFHQPHEDDEVDDLGDDGEPADRHGYFAPCSSTWFQKGLAKIRIIETTKQ